MGKRKYVEDKGERPKKSKTSDETESVADEQPRIDGDETESVAGEQPQNVDENKDNKNERLGKVSRLSFDLKHFRKELASKQGQTMALTQFLQVCLNPDNEADYMLEYLKVGGNSHEILHQISADNKKNITLATPAFHLFHLIILKVQSSLPHLISVTEEASRYFLNTFMSTVEIMISENSGPRHRKIILKLLTSMVTLNPDLGIEVLSQAPLTPKHLQYIVEKANYKEKDNVRTCFVHFMTSFLVDGHLPLIKALLEKQGLLALVIPGLIQDEAEAVLMFLNILKKNVIDNTLISKSLKLKTFSHQVLHNMFKIFSWKGPPELSNEAKSESGPEIMNLLSDILLTLFTSHRLGLYFNDKTLGMVEANKNVNLYKAILTLKRPWENEYECSTMLQILYKCPDLHRAMVTVIEQSFEPQHSPIWEKTTVFVTKLLNRLKPEDMIPRMSNLNPVQIANFIRFVTLPVPLLKFIQTNLSKDKSISIHCVRVLVKMLQSLKRYIQILELEDTNVSIDLRNKLEYFVPKHLPPPSAIVTLIKDVIENKHEPEPAQGYKLTKVDDTDSLILLLDLLILYNEVHPAFFETIEGNLDLKKILEFTMQQTTGQTALLKFKVVSIWLMLDSTAISLKNAMFKDLFLIMLEVYMSDDDTTWIEAKDVLLKFLKNTSIFEADEDEIHLMLYTLRSCKVNPSSLIGDIVEYVIENNTELTEYVRNQTIHFEISDENTEADLTKLFDDLMENKNTEDCGFLENKIPSPFIVGCIQYIQTRKDAKKNLKHFLSLYVANLLHFNYTPELTEVFIGDSKLDARSYVASWIGQPVALPENIAGTDNVLKRMSESIIANETVSLNEIFPSLEEVDEGSDIIVDDKKYRVITEDNIDSSEILIWAKYLIFCTVRLTNMKILNEVQQKKIGDYIECIICIAKKHHMVDVCRVIVLAIFKNPHFLKIYSPLDAKSESNMLATKFILQIIKKHADIVMYLDKKHCILKSYQQKNLNELLKAFIKINKKKNVNSNHTIEVLEVIGLAKEDDSRLFNQIFNTEIKSCVKDDKEPGLALELLKVLILKYSQSITTDLSQHILKKSVKLYTDLLISKEVSPNLTNIENALIAYFESKPYQVKHVSEEFFKRFFKANVTRKSTSQLASVLLKFNPRFCNSFRDQLNNAEIICQRELTLPLGCAVICHNQFLIDNKELLPKVYIEYKSNIMKLLEKPHKAGQIYVSCWRFIQKLIMECMELQDCEKLFSKGHKYETVELSHVNLLQTTFLKMCLSDGGRKKENLINYYLSMMQLTILALKENKDDDILNALTTNVFDVVQVSKFLDEFGIDRKEDFQKVIESAVWQNFCKAILKDSLKIKTSDQKIIHGPKLLQLLSHLVKLFYPKQHDDIVSLFEMVTSHSEFLNVMLSHHSSEIKSRLVEFLTVLITLNNSVMKPQQIPVYLSAYHATRSPCDILILSLLQYYESNGQPVNDYKPYVWGDSAANYYAVRKTRSSSLWGHPSPNQVLNLLEKDVIERTVRNFPVNQKLDYAYELPNGFTGSAKEVVVFREKSNAKDEEAAITNLLSKPRLDDVLEKLKECDVISVSHVVEEDNVYDPVFLFSLLSHLLAPGSMASCFKLFRTGLLSLPVVALSSHCPTMRAAAYHVLHRFCMLLELETKHKNDKLFLTDFIKTLRHSLFTAINNAQRENELGDLKNPRIPTVDALYLAKALMVSTAPFDPLYKPVNNFLIAKDFVDLTVVPDFLTLFHDSDVESNDRRMWILDTLRDGIKTMTDINVVFKTMCLKMIMDYYSSVLSDRKVKEKILGVISSIVAIPRAFEILLEGYGLLSWLHSSVRQIGKDDKVLVKRFFVVINNMLYSMLINSFAKNLAAKMNAKNGKRNDEISLKVNKDVEHEILIILYDLLHCIEDLEVDEVISYVKTFGLVSKRTVKMLSKSQMMCLMRKCSVYLKDDEITKLLTKTLDTGDVMILKSNVSKNSNDSNGCLFKELSTVVSNYLI